jgi:hypothetical protein
MEVKIEVIVKVTSFWIKWQQQNSTMIIFDPFFHKI